ncbi:MAG: CAP domain-containing protein [Marinobacter sp.]
MPKQAKKIMPGFRYVMTFFCPRSPCVFILLFFLGFSSFLVAGNCEMNEADRSLLNRVNEARSQPRQCGNKDFNAASPLDWNCKLADAAQAHSEDMAELDFFSHTGSDGSQIGERVNDRSYRWSAVGENIAAGQNSVGEVVDAWLSSPGHCANIMRAQFSEMGAAKIEAPSSQYSPYWTQVFARPR